METFSKKHLILTAVAIVVIGWLVFTYSNRSQVPIMNTPVTTTPTPAQSWPSVATDKEVIEDSNQYYSITAAYPVTADSFITNSMKTFVEEQITQFKDDTSWATDPATGSAASGSLSLDVSYQETKSKSADTYVFTIVTYTGGAHGLQATKTFAFDEKGKAIMLEDLFTNTDKGLGLVATFVQAEITKKNISDAKWIKEGAGADPKNYQNFSIGDTGITFIFDPYQVAPYAAGTQNILVPFSVFKSAANPELFS